MINRILNLWWFHMKFMKLAQGSFHKFHMKWLFMSDPLFMGYEPLTCLFMTLRHIWAASWQTQQMAFAPSEDSDQPRHPPSLIRVFAVHMKKALVLSYPLSAQRRLWSDWADAQADLNLRWAHSHFIDFVMRRLIYVLVYRIWGSLCQHIKSSEALTLENS